MFVLKFVQLNTNKMWLRIISVLLVAGLVQAYINSDYYSDRSSKSSYLNYELNRFKHRVSTTTTTERARVTPWSRSYQNYRKYYTNPSTETSYEHKIRHTNRFPKMDRLLHRMSNTKSADLSENSYRKSTEYNDLKSENNKKINQKWVTENPYRRVFTTTTESDDPEEYYGEDEVDIVKNKNSGDIAKHQEENEAADNNADEADDDEEDNENEDESDDDDESEDDSEDWQAEEPTEEPTERTFTEYKWKHYGTRARVEESRKNHGITSSTMRKGVAEAVEHARRVNVLGACREPRPRLIRVQQVYPDAGKAYIPHCTLLHRCADDTGCCRSTTLTCAPKHQAVVHLHFYTGRPGSYNVEKLAFINHTECHCVDRSSEVMSRDAADEGAVDERYPLKPSAGEHIPIQIAPEPIRRCRCSDLYTPQIVHGQCRCECSEGNRDCMRIKRGKEYFSLKDRLCIQKGECGYPACEFGVYIRYSGRCPRKQEKLDAFSRVQPQ